MSVLIRVLNEKINYEQEVGLQSQVFWDNLYDFLDIRLIVNNKYDKEIHHHIQSFIKNMIPRFVRREFRSISESKEQIAFALLVMLATYKNSINNANVNMDTIMRLAYDCDTNKTRDIRIDSFIKNALQEKTTHNDGLALNIYLGSLL